MIKRQKTYVWAAAFKITQVGTTDAAKAFIGEPLCFVKKSNRREIRFQDTRTCAQLCTYLVTCIICIEVYALFVWHAIAIFTPNIEHSLASLFNYTMPPAYILRYTFSVVSLSRPQ